ncbi:MAG: efflux transporter outer membrane subunit [Verrucomicrobiales bacterium]|nr:efflux transporter outer membrane subunit [Verrucomicrobiales bacterium]
MTVSRLPLLTAALTSLLLNACAHKVGIDYTSPDLKAPDAWSRNVVRDLKGGSGGIENWWKKFNDSKLNQLIAQARKANPNLKIAYQQINESRARRGVAYSQLFPNAAATADYQRTRSSESLFFPPPTNPNNSFSVGFDSGWEIDVFGGIRRAVESSQASVEASVEAYRDVLVSLEAEVALNYIEMRTLQKRIYLAKENIQRQRDSHKLTKDRFDAGLVPEIDVTQAETNLYNTEAVVPTLESQLTFARNRLASLLGKYAGSLDKQLGSSTRIPTPPRNASIGLPTNLLRSRPDVRQAERELAAQTARVGVATADLYPRFSLLGNLNLQALDADNLFSSTSRAFGIAPSVRWQIFAAGGIRNNIRIEKTRVEQAYKVYENALLLAVEETENSLVSISKERQRFGKLRQSVKSTEKTVKLVKDNYQNGLVDFQNVLDAERTLFTAQDDSAISEGTVSANYVRLFKALGGGTENVLLDSSPKRKNQQPTSDKKP